MKKLMILIGCGLLMTFCKDKIYQSYDYMYTFTDQVISIPVSDTPASIEISVSKDARIDGGAAGYTDVEIVPEGTTAVEGTDFTLSAKRLQFVKNQQTYKLKLNYTASFTKGKTLTLKLVFPPYPGVDGTSHNTTVITAQ